jgi:transcriptional regulator with XRE-family HTH domain
MGKGRRSTMNNKKYMIDFARNLKELREGKGYTYRDLEAVTGIGKSNLESYEKCKNAAGLDAIVTIAKYFNVNIHWLIGESTERGTYGKS